MKLNIKEITAMIETLPLDPEGKKFAGVEFRRPLKGDLYVWEKRWLQAVRGHSTHPRLVAIYEDTPREDGTPMDINQLPEFVGYRAEYGGWRMTDLKGADAYAVFSVYNIWSEPIQGKTSGADAHYVRLYKIETHREEDGTPMELPKPEFEGYRAEYCEKGMTDLKDADAYAVYCKPDKMWLGLLSGIPSGADAHYVRLYKIETHREDGTPMELPQPEFEGYRTEYGGKGMTDLKGADAYAVYDEWCEEWCGILRGKPSVAATHHARLYKIAQPTTIKDLVGKGGQKNAYLHYKDGASVESITFKYSDGRLSVCGNSVTYHARQGRRWSHNPSTDWENTNKFVPEEKEDSQTLNK